MHKEQIVLKLFIVRFIQLVTLFNIRKILAKTYEASNYGFYQTIAGWKNLIAKQGAGAKITICVNLASSVAIRPSG